jgi:hypothetical protein
MRRIGESTETVVAHLGLSYLGLCG